MTRRTTVLVLSLLLTMPAAARADDGGWWDWFWRYDTVFIGGGSDFHVLCLDKEGHVVHHGERGRALFGCEEWFVPLGKVFTGQLPVHDFEVQEFKDGKETWRRFDSFSEIKNEFDLRAGVHWSLGTMDPPGTKSQSTTWLVSTMFVYRHHWNGAFAGEAGVGSVIMIPTQTDTVSRGMVSAALVWSAGAGVDTRLNVGLLPGRVSSTDIGDANQQYTHSPEWTLGLTTVIDLRKVGRYKP
jgi:hypothetical protein